MMLMIQYLSRDCSFDLRVNAYVIVKETKFECYLKLT